MTNLEKKIFSIFNYLSLFILFLFNKNYQNINLKSIFLFFYNFEIIIIF